MGGLRRSNRNVDRLLTRISLMGALIDRDVFFNCKEVNWYATFTFSSLVVAILVCLLIEMTIILRACKGS